jgi:hypothetical protein
MKLLWRNLTTNQTVQFPAFPLGQTLEREQGYAVFAVLGGEPQIQITAAKERKLTLELDLWGEEGAAFYENVVYPAYGFGKGFKPDLIRIAWGSSSQQIFEGYPIGQAPTKFELEQFGRSKALQVFAYTFDLTLVGVGNSKPLGINTNTGNLTTPTQANHVVKNGETLQSIAKLYNVNMQDLAKANGYPAQRPAVGTRLVIPRG